MNKWRFTIGLALVVASGCSDSGTMELEEFVEVPDPPVLGIDSLVVGSIAYACGRWSLEPPASGWLMLDLFFWVVVGQSEQAPGPGQIEALLAEGGRVVHSLQFPAVRAVVSVDAVQRLWQQGVLSFARDVPYIDRRDISVLIGFNGGSEQEWRSATVNAGGSVEDVIPQGLLVAAILPDDRTAELRAEGLVSFVQVNGLACVIE